MITNKINEDIKQAMKAKESVRLTVLRSLKNAFTNAAIQSGNVANELTDVEAIGIIRKQVQQRQDSYDQFFKADRLELADKEKIEQEFLKKYLPLEIAREVLEGMVERTVIEFGATTRKDAGKVIKRVVELVNGGADNRTISSLVMERLS